MDLKFHYRTDKYVETEGIYRISHLNRAIDYMQRYNDILIKSVVLLTSPSFDLENSSFYEDIRSTASQKQTDTFLLHMIMSKNTTNTMNIIQKTSFPSIIIFYDFEPSTLLQKAFSEIHVQHTRDNSWLIMLSSDYQNYQEMYTTVFDLISTFPKYLSKFSLNSQMYAVASISGITRLFELYQNCNNQSILIRELTYLSHNKSYEYNPKLIWDRRADLHQCSIKVGYFEDGSWLSYRTNDDLMIPKSEPASLERTRQTFSASDLTLYGPLTHFFAILQSKLNFSVTWVHVDDKIYGAFDNEINDWNGIVGMVLRGQIDTSILDLTITEKRSSVIKFTIPVRNYKYRLFMKKPGPSLSWNTFLNVFHVAYWCALVASFTVCSIFLASFALNSYHNESEKIRPWTKIMKFGEAFSTTARAFAALGVDHSNYSCTKSFTSSRVLTLVICMCGMLNYYIYNAGLISFLMVQDYELPINELGDILIKPRYKLLVVGDTSPETLLKHSYDPTHRRIWEKSVKENGIISNQVEGEIEIRDDPEKVLFTSSPYFEMMFDSYPCNVAASKVGYSLHYGAYVFNKDSQYIDLFNYHITSIEEKGLETEWFDPGKTIMECEDKVDKNFRVFSYNDVISAFVICGLGSLIAVGYLAIEWVYTWWISASNKGCIGRKVMLQKELTRLRNFDKRTKECLAQIEHDFTTKLCDTYKEVEKLNSEIESLLCDISHRHEKIISLLEQELS